MADLTPEQLTEMNNLLEAQKTQLQAIGALNEADKKRLEAIRKLQNQIADAQGRVRSLREQDLENNRQAQIDLETQNELLEDQIEQLKEIRRQQGSLSPAQQDQIKALTEQIVANDAVIAQLEVENELRDSAGDVAEDLLATTFGIKKQQSGVVGELQKSVNAGKSFGQSLADVGSDMLDRMGETLTVTNVLASVASKIVESTVMMVQQTDAALASFNQSTSAAGQLNEVIFQASLDTKQFGVGMQDTVAAAQELYTAMSGFTGLTTEAQQEVITFTAGLTKAGVAAADTGKILDTAMKGFGMTTSEATDLSKELLATSQALGVPAGKLAADFNSAMGELAKYGPQGVEVFKGLAAQAKAAGVEMSTLLGVAGQFDTIEGAATAASKLNAVLGSNLNTMELLNATEEERIALLQQAVNATGKSFDELDRFEKQAVASAAGISDMNEAAKLFGKAAGDLSSIGSSMDDVTSSQADMEAVTNAGTSAMEKLGLVMEQMAIGVMPLINLLNFLLDILLAIVTPVFQVANAIINFLTPAFEVVGKAILGLTAAFAAYETVLFLVGAAQTIYGMITAGTLIPTLVGLAAAGWAAVAPWLPFVAAIALVIAIGYGLYELFSYIIGAVMGLIDSIGGFETIMYIALAPMMLMWEGLKLLWQGMEYLWNAIGGLSGALEILKIGLMVVFWPITLAYYAVMGLYDSFVYLYNLFSDNSDIIYKTIAEPFMAAFDVITGALKGFINFYIEAINWLIGKLNNISFTVPDWVPFIGGETYGINIPLIPMLEEGGQIDQEGAAYLHAGEKVIPAAEVSALDDVTTKAMDLMSDPMSIAGAAGNMVSGLVQSVLGTDEVVAAIKENTAAIMALGGNIGGAGGEGKTIILELNERQLGKAVTDVLNKKNQLALG